MQHPTTIFASTLTVHSRPLRSATLMLNAMQTLNKYAVFVVVATTTTAAWAAWAVVVVVAVLVDKVAWVVLAAAAAAWAVTQMQTQTEQCALHHGE